MSNKRVASSMQPVTSRYLQLLRMCNTRTWTAGLSRLAAAAASQFVLQVVPIQQQVLLTRVHCLFGSYVLPLWKQPRQCVAFSQAMGSCWQCLLLCLSVLHLVLALDSLTTNSMFCCLLCPPGCRFIANRFLRKTNLPQHQVEQHLEW